MANINMDDTQLKNDVYEIFNKRFHYQKPANGWCLPKANELFRENYEYENLQSLKHTLNNVKSKLNNYNISHWSEHTRQQNPSCSIIQYMKYNINAEFVTGAWCKFYQCVCTFPQMVPNPRLNTLHLCDGPGAFIASLNHYLYSHYKEDEVEWNWLATTLNPYYEGNSYNEMINDDRFIFSTLDNWVFYTDFTGNIMNIQNQVSILQECKSRFSNNGEVHLITADGSVNCYEVAERQEEEVDELILAEILTALTILSHNGCFLIKMFTLFNASSVCKLFLLNCIFEQVYVYKPSASKKGNSEVYVICLKYNKNTANLPEILHAMQQGIIQKKANCPLFVESIIPKDFLMQHETCCRLFMHYQITTIEYNIKTYYLDENEKKHMMNPYMRKLRRIVCKEYCRRYNVQSISDELKISKQDLTPWFLYRNDNSYTEIQRVKNASINEQLQKLKSNIHQLSQLAEDPASEQIDVEYCIQNENIKPIMKVYRGCPIDQLRSSLFVSKNIMEIGVQFQYLCSTIDPFIPKNAKAIMIEKGIEINYHNVLSLVSNKRYFSRRQFRFFYNVLDIMVRFQPRKIQFSNMPFITHFSVSVLKYLSYIFQNITISFKSETIITLQGHREHFKKSLKVLHDIIKENYFADQKEDQHVISLMHLHELHRQDFNAILLNFNKKILLYNYCYIITKIKQ